MAGSREGRTRACEGPDRDVLTFEFDLGTERKGHRINHTRPGEASRPKAYVGSIYISGLAWDASSGRPRRSRRTLRTGGTFGTRSTCAPPVGVRRFPRSRAARDLGSRILGRMRWWQPPTAAPCFSKAIDDSLPAPLRRTRCSHRRACSVGPCISTLALASCPPPIARRRKHRCTSSIPRAPTPTPAHLVRGRWRCARAGGAHPLAPRMVSRGGWRHDVYGIACAASHAAASIARRQCGGTPGR